MRRIARGDLRRRVGGVGEILRPAGARSSRHRAAKLAALVIVSVGAMLAVSLGSLAAPAARAASGPVAPDPAALPSTAALRSSDAFLARLGVRPTGSQTQARYIAWIRQQLAKIHGIRTNDL